MQGLACLMPPRIQDGDAFAPGEYQPNDGNKLDGDVQFGKHLSISKSKIQQWAAQVPLVNIKRGRRVGPSPGLEFCLRTFVESAVCLAYLRCNNRLNRWEIGASPVSGSMR